MLEAVGSSFEFENLDGMPVLDVGRFGLTGPQQRAKRAFDLVVGGVATVVLSPVLIAIAIAIRVESRGPVLFRQVRVGRDASEFAIFKFRTMVADAESRTAEVMRLSEIGEGMFKLAADRRITRIGALLRKSSLDELPQLFNVLRGDMSLVGPRPLVVDEDAQITGLDRTRLHFRPGLTGPWQILGARVPMQEMVSIDYLYVSNWSLWSDAKVVLRTIAHVLRRGSV
jgi:lipopolysaccharide/colanic/teichoic acid biosynthesis glycosyltransferase